VNRGSVVVIGASSVSRVTRNDLSRAHEDYSGVGDAYLTLFCAPFVPLRRRTPPSASDARTRPRQGWRC